MVAEALGTLRLQAVIGRIGRSLHHGEAAPARNDAVIIQIAQRLALGIERRIRLRAIQQLVSELADIGYFEHGVADDFSLQRKIYLLDVRRTQTGIGIISRRQSDKLWIGDIRG